MDPAWLLLVIGTCLIDPGYGPCIIDPGYCSLPEWSWLLVPVWLTLDIGPCLIDPRYWPLPEWPWLLVPSWMILVIGPCLIDPGYWSLPDWSWLLVLGFLVCLKFFVFYPHDRSCKRKTLRFCKCFFWAWMYNMSSQVRSGRGYRNEPPKMLNAKGKNTSRVLGDFSNLMWIRTHWLLDPAWLILFIGSCLIDTVYWILPDGSCLLDPT